MFSHLNRERGMAQLVSPEHSATAPAAPHKRLDS
jgi:hypothetical protein